MTSSRGSTSSEDGYETGPESFTSRSSSPSSSAATTTLTTKQGKLSRIRSLKKKIKDGSKAIVDTTKVEQTYYDADGSDTANQLHHITAFSPQRLRKNNDSSLEDTLLQAPEKLHSVSHAIRHPVDATKQRIASRVASSDQPQAIQQIDESLLDAHENLSRVQSDHSEETEDGEDALRSWLDTVEDIGDQKESLKVAWHTKRFVHRARVVYQRPILFPKSEWYREYDDKGNQVRFQWERWVAHFLIFLSAGCGERYVDEHCEAAFSRTTLIHHVERIIVASGPWQEYVSSLRQVYRWEDRRRTGKWFAIFASLWVTNYVVSFIYAYIIYVVLRNRLQPSSVEALRETRKRAVNRGAQALKFTEVINRHGSGDWLDPLIEDLGPLLQRELGDLADHLEILINFYEWKDPLSTEATLFFFCSMFAIGAFSSTDFSMRAVNFVCIMAFFVCWPVSSLYPKYRHLVSPVKWVFWGNPSNADWAFSYLQEHARSTYGRKEKPQQHMHIRGEDMLAHRGSIHYPNEVGDLHDDSLTLNQSPSDVLPVFRCRYHKHLGRLSISRGGIQFNGILPKRDFWEKSYLEILELRKTNPRGISGKIIKEQLLEFEFFSGETLQLDFGKRRDEAFNTIIGFSGLQWSHLHTLGEDF